MIEASDTDTDIVRRRCARGELVRELYRLGHHAASGVLTIAAATSRNEVFVLRRGGIVVPDAEPARRAVTSRLARLVAIAPVELAFEDGVATYPPGAQQLPLARWVRTHLEQQLDGALADDLVTELAGVRLSIKAELVPAPADETDRRILAAMNQPRRLDQIWPLARTPRFRLLAFVHFLRAIGALGMEGIAAQRARPETPHELLGVAEDADADTVKRAYRQLARALHPDLQSHLDLDRRRALETRLAEITAAYDSLLQRTV